LLRGASERVPENRWFHVDRDAGRDAVIVQHLPDVSIHDAGAAGCDEDEVQIAARPHGEPRSDETRRDRRQVARALRPVGWFAQYNTSSRRAASLDIGQTQSPAYLGGVTLFPEEFSRLGAGLEHEQNYRHIANTHLRSEIGLLQEPCKLIVLQRDIRHMDPQISTDKYFFGTS
jgi:hypothetical protein